MNEQLDELYRDILMEHYKYPRGKKHLDHPDITNEGQNPVCGDEIQVSLNIDGDNIKDVSVNCMGCAISVASGSMLADMIKGKSIAEIKKIAGAVKAMLKGEKIPDNIDLGDLEALGGVNKFPVRIKCALLSWTTMIDAIEARETGHKTTVSTTE